jgi:hypothetical protein
LIVPALVLTGSWGIIRWVTGDEKSHLMTIALAGLLAPK